MRVTWKSVSLWILILGGVWNDERMGGESFVPSFVSSSVRGARSIVGNNSAEGGGGRESKSRLMGIKGFRAWFESQFPEAVVPLTHYNAASKNTKKKDVDCFDHVLMDVNQLLHVVMRRAKSEGHALTLLIKELDHHCTIAQPKKSLVLALDGPPSAAKLATQRRRRYSTVIRGKIRNERMEFIQKRQQQQQLQQQQELNQNNTTTSTAHSSLLQLTKNQNKNKKKNNKNNRRSKLARDVQTLCITPGTDFMERAHSAILYWAWQRLSNPFGPLAHVKIYISPSNVPGEGEVKLLDWLWHNNHYHQYASPSKNNHQNHKKRTHYHNQQQRSQHKSIIQPGDSVAIMGGDSDLVLEAFIISPSYITHNVFCILPDGSQKSYAISLWEATRTLYQFLQPQLQQKDIMRVRTDLVLLLIMNGNDYLPKLRGSSGFHKLFHTYLRLLKNWLLEDSTHQIHNPDTLDYTQHKHGTKRPPPFLVDPDTLQFNIPFCIAFFRKLALAAPKVAPQSELLSYQSSVTPLSHLHTLIDSGFLPKPILWKRLTYQDYHKEKKNGSVNTPPLNGSINHENFVKNGKMELLRLSLGNEGNQTKTDEPTDDITTRHLIFETLHDTSQTMKRTKQCLANIALENILGKDYIDMHEYLDSSYDVDDDSTNNNNNSNDNDENSASVEEEKSEFFLNGDTDKVNNLDEGKGDDSIFDDDDEQSGDDTDSMSISSSGYSWEVSKNHFIYL